MSLRPNPSDLPQRAHAAIGRHLVQRWCDLAEARLAHLAELFESGRWSRYHSETEFLDNVQEARVAVDRWRALLGGEGSATPLSTTMPSADRVSHGPSPSQPVEARPAPPRLVSVTQSPDLQPGQEATIAAEPDWAMLTPAAIAERYPMLRAAM